jgi:hypothetical protein
VTRLAKQAKLFLLLIMGRFSLQRYFERAEGYLKNKTAFLPGIYVSQRDQGCQMVYFQTNNLEFIIWVHFG